MKLGMLINGSVDSTPFVPLARSNPIALGAAALGASVLGNLLGFSSNKSNNETNLQIARETNAQNYQMFKEQNAFNLDMWNKQNEYNLPSNVVQRLKQAGINPAAMFGQATPAGSLQSAQPHAMVAPQMNAWQPDTNSMLGAVDAFNQSRLAASQVKNINAQTDRTIQDTNFERSLNPHRLKFLQETAKKEGYLGNLARTQLAYEQAVNGMKISQVFQDFRLSQKQYQQMEQNIALGELQKSLLQIEVAYAPKMKQAELEKLRTANMELKASIGLINANTLLSNEERLNKIEQRASQIIDNEMKGVDRDIKKELKEAVINNSLNRFDIDYWNSLDAEYKAKSSKKSYLVGDMPSKFMPARELFGLK